MYRNIVPRTGRILAASVASKRAAIPSRNMLMARSFHSYRPVLQQERPPVTPEDLGALGKALQDNPELLRRFTEVVDYLQEHELIKPGKQPTMMDVMKIVSKKEARDKLAACKW